MGRGMRQQEPQQNLCPEAQSEAAQPICLECTMHLWAQAQLNLLSSDFAPAGNSRRMTCVGYDVRVRSHAKRSIRTDTGRPPI